MSAGHRAHRNDVPPIDDAIYARVRDLVAAARLDSDHTIPWLANRSADGRTVYRDRSVPKLLPRTGIDTGETLPYHELGEWDGMNEGLIYDEAHRIRGNPCEKRRVEELDGVWVDYQDEMAEYIREVDDEAMTDVPGDIDKRVFVDDGDIAALEAILADNPKGSTMMRKFLPGQIVADQTLVGERQILVVASDATVDRVKDVMMPSGCKVDNYLKNNIVLADHERGQPIGNAEPRIGDKAVHALITFAPKGLSAKADEYCALAKAGVIKAISVGFDPIEFEPRKGGGFLHKQWELMEISVLGGVPCNPNATVVARAAAAVAKAEQHEWKVGASRNLPIGDDKAWDGPAAEARIFDSCGFDGDKPDTSKCRKAFLVYDAANPALKGGYKLPFADVVDGRFTAMPAGIRAAASRLPQADIPSDVADKARAVLDHYEAQMKDDDGKRAGVGRAKAWRPKVKGLYEVAELAAVLEHMGWIQSMSAWEAEVEQDASKLPAMLAKILADLAGALVAMTQEETAELLAGHGLEPMLADLDYVEAGATPQIKAVRAALRKAGRVLSQANQDHLVEIGKCLDKMADCHVKAADLHDDLHDVMVEWMNHGTSAGDHAKAMLDAASGKPGDDDDEKPDEELAFDAAQRKRQVEVLRLGAATSI